MSQQNTGHNGGQTWSGQDSAVPESSPEIRESQSAVPIQEQDPPTSHATPSSAQAPITGYGGSDDPRDSEIASLQQEVARLNESLSSQSVQCEEYLNGWKRAKADYINFKNEQEKRSKELANFANLTSLIAYIPIVENFRIAFQHVPNTLADSEWVKGVSHIYAQMKEMLKTMGVAEVESQIGKAFDPATHQAVGQEQRDDFGDDVVTQEVSVAYRFDNRVIAPAKVIVNKLPSKESPLPQATEGEVGGENREESNV